jgi:peptidoglycan L-alanyl-D-glutamate endopeptidase CwlK
MASNRTPGVSGTSPPSGSIADGTLCLSLSPLPGTVCISRSGIRYVPAWDKPVGSNPPPDSSIVDHRSETNIATLLPEVQPYARALVHRAADHGITIKIISGTRTYEKQNDLYAQGRTKPGGIVTNAQGGQSNHNFGLAFDIGVFKGKIYLEDSPLYKTVGGLGVSLGLDWGGNWKSLQDEPHFELRPPWAKNLSENEMIKELSARKESGRDIFDSGNN